MKGTVFGFTLLTIFLWSCIATQEVDQESLFGKYEWHGGYGVGSNITLRSDSTFTYVWYEGLLNGKTEGKWILTQNTLILNSEKQLGKDPKYTVFYSEKNDSQEFKIHTIDQESKEPLIYLTCTLIREKEVVFETTSDINGICLLPFNKEASKMRFSYTGYHKIEIPINQLESNAFTLQIRHDFPPYLYFTNKKWKVKNDKLYSPEVKRDKYAKKNYYEKVKE